MSVQIQKLSQKEYETLLSNARNISLWLMPKLTTCYKDKMLLSAYRGNQLVGIWVIPLITKEGRKIARREYRYLPYSSPYLFEEDNLRRRDVTYELFKYLTNNCTDVNLPFDPRFKEFAPIQGLGAFVEWRHTHILGNPIEYQQISSRLRNHIKNARKLIQVEINTDYSKFNFEQAIIGLRKEQLARQKSAINLIKNGHAKIVSAYLGNKICGGIFIATDSVAAYMMHSWQSNDAPRGTMSALILEGTNWALKKQYLKQYDFEGSLLQKVDYYYSGFNCKIESYGHVFWSKEKETLHKMIEESINIPERLLTT